MRPEQLFVAAGVFACASALFAVAGATERGRGEYTAGIVACAVLAVFFLAGGIDAWNRLKKGGP